MISPVNRHVEIISFSLLRLWARVCLSVKITMCVVSHGMGSKHSMLGSPLTTLLLEKHDHPHFYCWIKSFPGRISKSWKEDLNSSSWLQTRLFPSSFPPFQFCFLPLVTCHFQFWGKALVQIGSQPLADPQWLVPSSLFWVAPKLRRRGALTRLFCYTAFPLPPSLKDPPPPRQTWGAASALPFFAFVLCVSAGIGKHLQMSSQAQFLGCPITFFF